MGGAARARGAVATPRDTPLRHALPVLTESLTGRLGHVEKWAPSGFRVNEPVNREHVLNKYFWGPTGTVPHGSPHPVSLLTGPLTRKTKWRSLGSLLGRLGGVLEFLGAVLRPLGAVLAQLGAV